MENSSDPVPYMKHNSLGGSLGGGKRQQTGGSGQDTEGQLLIWVWGEAQKGCRHSPWQNYFNDGTLQQPGSQGQREWVGGSVPLAVLPFSVLQCRPWHELAHACVSGPVGGRSAVKPTSRKRNLVFAFVSRCLCVALAGLKLERQTRLVQKQSNHTATVSRRGYRLVPWDKMLCFRGIYVPVNEKTEKRLLLLSQVPGRKVYIISY